VCVSVCEFVIMGHIQTQGKGRRGDGRERKRTFERQKERRFKEHRRNHDKLHHGSDNKPSRLFQNRFR